MFFVFSWLGRSVIPSDALDDNNNDDEEEELFEGEYKKRPPTDLLALGASLVTSGILAPFGPTTDNIVDASLGYPPWLLPIVGGFLAMGLWVWTSSMDNKRLPGGTSRSGEAVPPEEDPMISNERQWMDLWDRSLEAQESRKRDQSDEAR
jgi:hypothetical protein